ncbi:hypothetical protein [Cupriavidus sp. TMH.W2]|uniref:hypothetical protein n=1 Tax=Cupriavidus sp. TMH.W2 TaxID=3434465 RepID=UPI003D7727EC
MKFELVLRGFDGSTDETDDLVIWVGSNLSSQDFEIWLIARNLLLADRSGVVIEWSVIPDSFEQDFQVPDEGVQLEARIRELVDISTMTEREFRALQAETERRELVTAKGEDTPENDARLVVLSDLLDKAPWCINMDDGTIVLKTAVTS